MFYLQDLRNNKIQVAIKTSHMMIIVVDVFYRQQTLRTSEMSLIFNNFQYIYIYIYTNEYDASILSLSPSLFSPSLFVSSLLVDYLNEFIRSILYIIISFLSSCEKDERKGKENERTTEVITDHLNDG